MKVFYNRTQLARRLNIAYATLLARIEAGEIVADAKDAMDAELYSEEEVQRYEAALKAKQP